MMPDCGAILIGPMLAALVLAAAVAGGSVIPPMPQVPNAVAVVPDEPGAFVLSNALTYQAVAADLDADGAKEVVALVRGDGTSIDAVAWSHGLFGWYQLGSPIEVVPTLAPPGQGSVMWADAPTRLLVRDVAGGQRVTLVRQPRLNEPDIGAECCLLLHDLVISAGTLHLLPLAEPAASMEAISVLDFDGDGTDELLATQSVPPLGDTSYPTDAFVYRWNGEQFDAPTFTRLPIGSGDSPFVLGDSNADGGEEAGIIATLGRPDVYRISLTDGDVLVAEAGGIIATAAVAVSGGIAVIGPADRAELHAWPRGGALGPAVDLRIPAASVLGMVNLDGAARLLVRQAGRDQLHVVDLADPPSRGTEPLEWSAAAAPFASGPVRPFIGEMPGGGMDGAPAVLYAGRVIPADAAEGEFSTLAGAMPIGFVGKDRSWFGLLHAPGLLAPVDPAGGRLGPPVPIPGSAISLAPTALAGGAQPDEAVLGPEIFGATPINDGEIAVGTDGFVARIEAPPGSRVHEFDSDPSVIRALYVVPESGRLDVALVAPDAAVPNPRYRAVLSVTTPAGRAYLATWDVRVLTEPPSLEASVSTPFGSSAVEVSGRSVPYAAISVGGRPVVAEPDGTFLARVDLPPWPSDVNVVAVDPAGNRAALAISGVGFFDYRGLPWIPITVLLVGVAAVVLFLRVPRSSPAPRQIGDDAVLEEIDLD